mmetsp:Transcript_12526/g.37765  ORF Transcript_12526/g.37765 Transcript_12526/m.37765 type:complete len:436 (-) Transcript_12526:195-1502(-)
MHTPMHGRIARHPNSAQKRNRGGRGDSRGGGRNRHGAARGGSPRVTSASGGLVHRPSAVRVPLDEVGPKHGQAGRHRLVRPNAHHHRERAVLERHVRLGAGRQGGGDEAVQLVVGGAGMVSSLHQPNLNLLGSSRLISGDCSLACISRASIFSCASTIVPHSRSAGGRARSSYSAMNFEERRQRRKLTSLSSSCFVPCDGANASSFPRVPTSETSSWCFDASANMHSSSIARAPDWKSTITYALSSTSLSTLLWLTSCPPLAKMRRGSERRMRRMRSKKWTHFSTRVPPVRSLVRFQLPTFFRKGKRCSRIDSMRRSPIRPWSASWISRAIAGMYRYSIPHHSSGAVPPKPPGCLASATVSAQCEMSVQSGFSTRQCLPEARTCRITAWCVSLGVHTSTASTSLSCSISASRSSAITSRTPACCSSASAVCRDGS